MSRVFFALLCACASPVLAQTTYTPAATSPEQGVTLQLARTGNEVLVTWSLPGDLQVKRFEIYRHTRDNALGRTRAATVRTEPAIYLDQVTDETATYWYWLKITLANEQVVNVGPVATPDAKVWTP